MHQLRSAGITKMGFKAATAWARKVAYQADPKGYLQRGRTERKHRRVGLRPAPDTMAVLTGYLPVEQGIACYAALRRHADTTVAAGDRRTRDQIMADTLVERITGQAAAADVNVELQLMMPLDALINPDDRRVAMIPGYGPLPADLAWEIVTTSQGRKWWRRLFTAPTGVKGRSGPIVGGDPTRRCFDGWLAKLITTARRPNLHGIRTAMPQSATSTTSNAIPTADPRLTSTAAAPAPAATRSEKCRAGVSNSSTAASTAGHTRSSSPHPPATTTSAAHPTHHENGGVRRAESDR